MPKKRRATALDKQLRLVVALSRRNRRRADGQRHAAAAAAARSAALTAGSRALHRAILGAGDAAGGEAGAAAGSGADTLAAWRPLAAAEHTRRLQQAAAAERQQLLSSLPAVLDPSSLPRAAGPQRAGKQQQCRGRGRRRSSGSESEEEEDVEAFLDSLLLGADGDGSAACELAGPEQQQLLQPAQPQQQPQRQQQERAQPQLTQQQAQEEQEEQEEEQREQEQEQEHGLLAFAEQLDWKQLLGELESDEQLAAAFEELGQADEQREAAADAGAAADTAAEQRWRRAFVTALNAAALKRASAAAASVRAGQQQDARSVASSASTLQRAEAAAARRKHLLQRLARLAGPAAATAASTRAPASVSGSSADRAAAGGPAVGEEGWDSATRVSGRDAVGRLVAALRHCEAGEVLAESPELRGVHSCASVRCLLARLALARPEQPAALAAAGGEPR